MRLYKAYIYENFFCVMNKWLLIVLVIAMCSCKEKKVNLAGNALIKPNDFIKAFSLLALPYSVADTNIATVGDTTIIGNAVLVQFVPDSIINLLINHTKNYTIQPLGRIEKTTENYLLAIITQNKKIQLVAFVMDKKNKYLAYKSLLNNTANDGYVHSMSINREPTFVISKEKIGTDKQLQFSRVGWIYGSDKTFMVVINDTNEDPKKSKSIINPVDTLPRKNKLSGDYVQDKKNFISLRDGKDVKTYIFFIHFEKKDGTCVGELKGDLKLKDATTAVYNQGGDPCVVDFTFANNNITLKEKGSCGNRRGMECFFDDTFTKKKEVRKKK